MSLFVYAGLSVLATLEASAQSPSKSLSHYLRTEWGSEGGFPASSINVIAQTPDGYLWIGTENGLVRFDGREFHLFSEATSSGGPIGPVLGLISDSEGNLWVRLQGAGLLRYRDGKFEDFTNKFEIPELAVTQMCRAADGRAVFLTIMNGTLVFDEGKLRSIAPPPQLSDFLVISVALGSGGQYFLGTRDRGLFRIRDGRVSAVEDVPRDWQINALVSASADRLWIGTDKGLFFWDGHKISHAGLNSSLAERQILSMTKDREESVWVGTDRGMYRLDPGDNFSPNKQNFVDDGPVSAVFEDRENNIWAATSHGLERFRNTVFTTFSADDGLLPGSIGPVYADPDGRTWFAPTKGGLYWFKDNAIGNITAAELDKDVVYSVAGGNGDLWVARQRGGLTHLHNSDGRWDAVTYTKKDGLAQDSIFTVRATHQGTVWAGTLSAGLTRIRDGQLTTFTVENGLVSNTVAGIVESRDGTMWFATPRGLSGYSNDRWFSFSSKDGLPSDVLNCLFEDSAGVLWIGTASGLAAARAGKIVTPANTPQWLRESVVGIREDRDGFLWISTLSHVLRVSRARLLDPEFNESDIRQFDLADGRRYTDSLKRDEAVAADAAGRIWFSLTRGLAYVETDRLRTGAPPTILHIDGLFADGKFFDMRSPVNAPHPQRVTIDYAGLSLSVPERIRFKYKLDGFDRDWNGPVSTRQAIYTNLNPRSYTFRVIASNSDGEWNSAETVFVFNVEPAVWQTLWFQLFCVTLVASIALLSYRFRLRQLTRHLNVRFEERLAERTRIARELHDTLLQSLHGLMFRFQAARNMFDRRPEEAMEALDGAIKGTEEAIAESRDAIKDLRLERTAASDLAALLTEAGRELETLEGANADRPTFRVIIEGERQELLFGIQDEVVRIAKELLRNAFQHAHAHQIEAEIRYDDRALTLLVRDDGRGIDPKILKGGGRPGHWGLPGISERAKQIRAQIDFWSDSRAGTEVQLTVPGKVAYKAPNRPARRLFRKERAS